MRKRTVKRKGFVRVLRTTKIMMTMSPPMKVMSNPVPRPNTPKRRPRSISQAGHLPFSNSLVVITVKGSHSAAGPSLNTPVTPVCKQRPAAVCLTRQK